MKFRTMFIFLLACMGCLVGGMSIQARVVTPGVEYTKESFQMSQKPQVGNLLEIDLSNPHIQVELGIPQPLTSLTPTSRFAKNNTYDEHHVVGAINGSFYHLQSRLPAYLVLKNNRVSTFGVISTGNDEYMSVPSAFGILQDGTAKIGTFQYDISFEVGGKKGTVTSINKQRMNKEIILYTPSYSYSSTRTNSYGMEIVVKQATPQLDEGVHLGQPIRGVVAEVYPYGTGNAPIPQDGFVLSIHSGELAAQYSHIEPGEEIELMINVSGEWKNAQFMLASGPLLVQEGKVKMTIDETSSRARQRNPRTAVAVDQSGQRVFFVTVDGRQQGYSEGLTLKEFAQYLVEKGAYYALNLDGGGSTTMAVRQYGDKYTSVVNSPSDGSERAVSTILQVVSTSPFGQPTYFEFRLQGHSTLLVGSSVDVAEQFVLDEFYHPLTINKQLIRYEVEGNIGRMEGNTFVAERSGTGFIVGYYEGAVKKIPVKVIDAPARVEVTPSNITATAGESVSFTIQAFDADGKLLDLRNQQVLWSLSQPIGTISNNGLFIAGTTSGTAEVIANIRGTVGKSTINVRTKPLILDSFEKGDWNVETVRSEATISFTGNDQPLFHGSKTLKLQYNFQKGEEGTKAAYVVRTSPLAIPGNPSYLGVWVYGDQGKHWLRGTIIDQSGQEYTVSFTKEGGLDWTGWRYTKAQIPSEVTYPIQLKQLYVVETNKDRYNTGTLYFDQLQAEYGTSHEEPLFHDIPNDFWAKNEIQYLLEHHLIQGFSNGHFKPNNKLTRAHAAVLLARALNLPKEGITLSYQDVPASHLYYAEIAAVTKAGIMNGKQNGTIFDPDGTLTRAQMAAILVRAFSLKGDTKQPFKDVPSSYWAYKEIHALYANQITVPYEGHLFKPNHPVTRAQFSTFLYRVLQK
jgi:hypothetical protein